MNYSQQLNQLALYALLHMNSLRVTTSKYNTITATNTLIIKYLKKQQLNQKYNLINKDIKKLIKKGRHGSINLEQRLNEILTMSFSSGKTDVELFVTLVQEIESDLSVAVNYFDQASQSLSHTQDDKTIFIYVDELTAAFDGKIMVKPLTFIFTSSLTRQQQLVDLMEESPFFSSTIKSQSSQRIALSIFVVS
ncbi:DUF2913 family protein [Vibrio sp. SS-MA-C1-2]|uniref:DUF2913 family protein n=1 Tax=Vibrio sp. SS-MA-C1-2 TaxID=2908646 RepID=UPI001F36718C|nr:DUF2913 family protein [Vibrio sp. SS-MA-C1-2]UJF19969.1 DUF2913 family protein [Vibrio sp. SS-MA-C1-2]